MRQKSGLKQNILKKTKNQRLIFFNLEQSRGKQKLWSKIRCDSGELKFGIENILEEQCKFYKNLFMTEGIDIESANKLLACTDAKLNKELAGKLESSISLEELGNAVFDFKKYKSPGFDGIPAEFYQHFWYLLKFDFLEVVEEILLVRSLTDSQYKGVLSLIYKNGERDCLKNWRPITLLNVDYKIIAKCLANRLKPILPNIIFNDQKGYVDGRNINEANRFIQDVISYSDIEQNEGIIIFLDQTKAFDRCEWQWIDLCLKHFGFGDKFCSWVNMLLKFSKTAITTNGYISDFFSISRSIKQGCPIAPLLYIIQAEPMACKIRSNQNIVGIQLPILDGRPAQAKLNQYVDDTQLFAKNELSLPHIFDDLSIYEKASGAKMNKEKTKGLFIGSLKNANPTFKDIGWTKNYVKTLGICHGYNIDDDNLWRDKIIKIKTCLQVWKSRNLSISGKVLIVKTFVHSVINFEIETRGIPNKYCKEIDKIISDFIWEGKKALVSAVNLKRPKYSGGLNLFSVSDIVSANMIKMVYKLIHSDVQNWNIIGKHYFKIVDSLFNQNFFLCTLSCLERITFRRPMPRYYQNALSNWSTFLKSFIPSRKTDILNASLFGNHKIKYRNKPILFKSFIKSDIKQLRDIWDTETNAFISDNQLLNKLHINLQQNFVHEWEILRSSIPKTYTDILATNVSVDERPTMSISFLKVLDVNGKFIKYNKLRSKLILSQLYCRNNQTKLHTESRWEERLGLESNFKWQHIWKNGLDSYASIKAKNFQWKFLYNAIFTEHRLSLMGLSNGLCILCKTHHENLIHLFCDCEKVKPFWEEANRIINRALHAIGYPSVTFSAQNIALGYNPHKFSNVINTLIFETKWYIWKYRNDTKFSIRPLQIQSFVFFLKADLKNIFSHKCHGEESNEIFQYIKDGI
jgi:hypothetical protein